MNLVRYILFSFFSYLFCEDISFGERLDFGLIESDLINEASGVVSGWRNSDLLWTHNDSGDGPIVYAIDYAGRDVASLELTNAKSRDWEDIGIGPGINSKHPCLYVADIGDNRAQRKFYSIHVVPEPEIALEDSSQMYRTSIYSTIKYTYPDGSRDAESIIVDPDSGDIYIISKREEPSVRVYKLAYPQSTVSMNIAEAVNVFSLYPIEDFSQGNWVVAADISSDGKYILVKSYLDIFILPVQDDIISAFNSTPKKVSYEPEIQGEAVGWHPKGWGYFTLSEETMGVESRLYFYPKKVDCIDPKAINYNPYASVSNRGCLYK